MKSDNVDKQENQQREKKYGESITDLDEKNNFFHKMLGIRITKERKEMVAILFLLGVFFLLIGNPLSTTKNEEKQSNKKSKEIVSEEITEDIEKDEYIAVLENKLEKTISGIEGAGKVLVMITLKDSGEKILDKNQPYESSSEMSKEEGKETEKSNMSSNQETVLVEVEGNTTPIVIQERYPDVEGVVVVCEGGDNQMLTLQIKEAVQALFSVDSHKIVVCKLQQ